MSNKTRREEVSYKLYELGKALIEEGMDGSDYGIGQAGGVLLALSVSMNKDTDMYMFSELCAMFSAKKMLMEEMGEEFMVNKLIEQEVEKLRKLKK